MGDAAWAVLWALALILEFWAIRHRPSWTLTHVTRRLFRIQDGPVGRWLFLLLWVPVAVWIAWHIAFET